MLKINIIHVFMSYTCDWIKYAQDHWNYKTLTYFCSHKMLRKEMDTA